MKDSLVKIIKEDLGVDITNPDIKVEVIPKGNRYLTDTAETESRSIYRILKAKLRKRLPRIKNTITQFADGLGEIIDIYLEYPKEDKK